MAEKINRLDFLKKLGALGIGGAIALTTIPKVFSTDLWFRDITTTNFGSSNITTSGKVTARLVKRYTQSSGSLLSFIPNCDIYDIYEFSTDAASDVLTVNNPTGTPTNGQGLLLKIMTVNKQTYLWGDSYRGGKTPLPTDTTGTSKIDYVAFIWNSADSKWELTGQSAGH